MTDESAERVEQAATRIGSLLDERWEIESLLGLGGTAAVYAARAGGERVAVKVLHPELTRSQRAVDRFRREGEALRTAKHPGVPRVYGEGTTTDGCPYLVLDLLLGETVEARRRRFGGKLAPAEVVRIALDVLDVLDVVHARGLLHRDIKPSNILWLDDGSIRLIDFGIAKVARDEGDVALTRTGALPGSLAFMSPEHALGIPSELDARSDLWSLGATMFSLLSGRYVHESRTEVAALALAASRRARSLGSVVSGLPPALVAVVDRALAFDRRKRFANAAEMARALAMSSLPATKRVGRVRPWHVALVATVLAAAGGATSFRTARPRGDEAPPGLASALASAPPAPPAPLPAQLGVEPRAAAAVPPSEALFTPPRGPATAVPTAHAVPRPRVAAVVTARGADSPAPPPSASADTTKRCDPPFVIDPATGTRRVKPGC